MGQPRPEVPPLIHAIGGSLGSAFALWLLFPLERARIDLQQSSGAVTTTASIVPEDDEEEVFEEAEEESWQDAMTETSGLVVFKERGEAFKHETTIWDCIQRLRNERTLYRGASTVVATIGISNFLFFFCNEFLKQQLGKKLTPGKTLLASCIAGICNVIVTNPLWVANMNLLQQRRGNLYSELTRIVRERGWRSLWAGTGASIWLVSNPIVQFFVYEQLKPPQKISPIQAFGTGAVAKLVATVLTYPLQVSQTVLRSSDRYQNTAECLIHLYQTDGYRALFRGMKAKLLQTVLTAALTFLTYEQIVAALASTLQSKAALRNQR